MLSFDLFHVHNFTLFFMNNVGC